MSITRRRVLAGAASAAALRPARASADVDVAVIGAGAAGLAAAKRIRAAGRSFAVLEARARVGGRAFTDASLGAPFDAGAEYLHWAERNPMRRVAEELGVRVEDDDVGSGRFQVLRDGQPLSDDERNSRRGAWSEVDRYLTPAGQADRSVAEAVTGAPEAVADAAAGLTRMALGEEPARVSVRDFNQLWSGDDLVIPSGYGALVARFGADVPVRLETPVTRVRWDGTGVAAETDRGTLRAKAAIVTVPIGVLRSGGLRFAPDLPPATQAAIEGLRMGALTKIALKVDRARFGAPEPFDFYDIGPSGATLYLTFWPYGRDLAVAAVGGDRARALCEAGEAAAVAFLTERLAAVFGTRARDAATAGRLAAWWTDPHAYGSYSIASPGHAAAREALRAPIGGRVWLAGEATAGGGAMTVGGAYLEGERAAGEVLKVV